MPFDPCHSARPPIFPQLGFALLLRLIYEGLLGCAGEYVCRHPQVLDFITYAKANSGKINFASAGIGSSSHVTGFMG
jgi:hypothetical protein